MTEIPKQLVPLAEAGFGVEESPWIVTEGPSENSAAYIVAEAKPGGYSYGLAYRPGLSDDALTLLAEEVRARIASLATDGPEGPYAWSTGEQVPGYYSWLSLHDLDPTTLS
ncbi:hypothetical protein [Janibacter sp. UYMM211]|uniref:hypothetical protein n=1 Tax=Janibacter sp. UYMM211 TaxID=3156342 RepID=UPI003397E35F